MGAPMSSFLESSGPAVDQAWSWFVVVATLVLLVAGWRVLGKLVQRHKGVDKRAGTKRLIAFGAALALGAGGYLAISGFEAAAKEGMHTTFIGALNVTVGESDYKDALKTVTDKPALIVKQQAGLANATALYEASPTPENLKARNELSTALNLSRDDLAKGRVNLLKLTPNHILWQTVLPMLKAHQDEQAYATLNLALDPTTVDQVIPGGLACARDDDTGQCTSNPPAPAAVHHTYRDTHTLKDVGMDQAIPEAWEHQIEFNQQMQTQMRWFVYPNLAGLVMAPFAFMGGSILGRVFVPSDTVGFKRYPGKAAGFFLLLGGGAVFAIPFAAWLLRDLNVRSKEGQISL